MSDYSYFTRAELMQVLFHKETELNKQLVKIEPTDSPGKKVLTDIKKRLENEIKAIQAKLKETVPPAPVAAPAEAAPAGDQTLTLANEQALMKSMQEQATVQNLLDVIRNVPKMVIRWKDLLLTWTRSMQLKSRIKLLVFQNLKMSLSAPPSGCLSIQCFHRWTSLLKILQLGNH